MQDSHGMSNIHLSWRRRGGLEQRVQVLGELLRDRLVLQQARLNLARGSWPLQRQPRESVELVAWRTLTGVHRRRRRTMRSRGPQVLKSVSQVRTWRQERLNQSVGFVPTMGALHDGHMSLGAHSGRRRARTQADTDHAALLQSRRPRLPTTARSPQSLSTRRSLHLTRTSQRTRARSTPTLTS